jgi:2-dehydropantoate 2-reductase
MNIAVLGPGGVGGLVAGVLHRDGVAVELIARESTAQTIAERGLEVRSGMFGDFTARVPAHARVKDDEKVDVLIVAPKATGLREALERVDIDVDTGTGADAQPTLVLPLLNGLDHIPVLRERFAPETVLAGTIRVESYRSEPGVIEHMSPFVLIDMATRYPGAQAPMEALGKVFEHAGIHVRVTLPVAESSEAQVMWSKLVRLNSLACTTSAYDLTIGEIRSTPELRSELIGAIGEACAVGQAEGAADVDPQLALTELELAHPTLRSSMQRDIAAGREPELDAIPGAVLRAGARHGIVCPTIERLTGMIAERAGVPAPIVSG